jgi:hypothetical protein
MSTLRNKKSRKRTLIEAALILILLPVIVPFGLFGLLLHFLNKLMVYLLVWLWWLPAGKDVLLVCSDSPVWREYVDTEIFPLVAGRAVVLNWSARHNWPKWSFAVRVFHTFGRGHDFNPMVVLFRPLRKAQIFRFLPAFKDFKHGQTESLEKLRRELMLAL